MRDDYFWKGVLDRKALVILLDFYLLLVATILFLFVKHFWKCFNYFLSNTTDYDVTTFLIAWVLLCR